VTDSVQQLGALDKSKRTQRIVSCDTTGIYKSSMVLIGSEMGCTEYFNWMVTTTGIVPLAIKSIWYRRYRTRRPSPIKIYRPFCVGILRLKKNICKYKFQRGLARIRMWTHAIQNAKHVVERCWAKMPFILCNITLHCIADFNQFWRRDDLPDAICR